MRARDTRLPLAPVLVGCVVLLFVAMTFGIGLGSVSLSQRLAAGAMVMTIAKVLHPAQLG